MPSADTETIAAQARPRHGDGSGDGVIGRDVFIVVNGGQGIYHALHAWG